jgi:hypothetical protein
LIPLAFLLAGTPALAQSQPEGMPNNAFLFEARLGVATPLVFINTGFGMANFESVTPTPSLLVGARLAGRIHVGLGFSFARFSQPGASNNIVSFVPTFAIDMIKSHDDRVAFYGKLGLPLGPIVDCNNGAPCDTGFGIGFDIALGARYAFHRMFALGLEAGVDGTFENPQRDNTVGLVGFYGTLVASFFAGK